jgi:hypothetical protein
MWLAHPSSQETPQTASLATLKKLPYLTPVWIDILQNAGFIKMFQHQFRGRALVFAVTAVSCQHSCVCLSFALFSIFVWTPFIFFFYPETKGLELEDDQLDLRERWLHRWCNFLRETARCSASTCPRNRARRQAGIGHDRVQRNPLSGYESQRKTPSQRLIYRPSTCDIQFD